VHFPSTVLGNNEFSWCLLFHVYFAIVIFRFG
jgi:hypothetical protein